MPGTKCFAMAHIQHDYARVHQGFHFARGKWFEHRNATEYLRTFLIDGTQVFVIRGIRWQTYQRTLYKLFFTLRLSEGIVCALAANGRGAIWGRGCDAIGTSSMSGEDLHSIRKL